MVDQGTGRGVRRPDVQLALTSQGEDEETTKIRRRQVETKDGKGKKVEGRDMENRGYL